MSQLEGKLEGNTSAVNLLASDTLARISSDINPSTYQQQQHPQQQQQQQQSQSSSQNQNQSHLQSSTANTSIWEQSSHPVALFFLFLFRSLAITTYILCGFFSDSYVFSTVIVVILLSIDFWTVRNISGRVLVGLRFWNQVDEDGSSYWVFESRDPSQAANPIDSKMFWLALYTFPIAWIGLFFIGILKFNISFLPIVILALVFNLTNTIGFTYADRDSKRKWANQLGSSGINGFLGQVGGGLLGSLSKVGIGKLFG